MTCSPKEELGQLRGFPEITRAELIRHFTPAELRRNLIYVIIAEATNMGLTAMHRGGGWSPTPTRCRCG